MTATLAQKIAARTEKKVTKAINEGAKFRADSFCAAYIAIVAFAAGVSSFIKTAPQSGYKIGNISASASSVARYCRALENYDGEESSEAIAAAMAKQGAAQRACRIALEQCDAGKASAHDIIFLEDYKD